MRTLNLLLGIALLAGGCQQEAATTTKIENQQQLAKEEIQALAKKYGVTINVHDVTPTVSSKGRQEQPPAVTREQLEQEFQALAAMQAEAKQSSHEAEKLFKQIEGNKFTKPSEYFALLDKYPTLKKTTIAQWGGPEGFEKYKQDALKKEAEGQFKNP